MVLVSFGIGRKLWPIFSFGFCIGPKPKRWFRSYTRHLNFKEGVCRLLPFTRLFCHKGNLVAYMEMTENALQDIDAAPAAA